MSPPLSCRPADYAAHNALARDIGIFSAYAQPTYSLTNRALSPQRRWMNRIIRASFGLTPAQFADLLAQSEYGR